MAAISGQHLNDSGISERYWQPWNSQPEDEQTDQPDEGQTILSQQPKPPQPNGVGMLEHQQDENQTISSRPSANHPIMPKDMSAHVMHYVQTMISQQPKLAMLEHQQDENQTMPSQPSANQPTKQIDVSAHIMHYVHNVLYELLEKPLNATGIPASVCQPWDAQTPRRYWQPWSSNAEQRQATIPNQPVEYQAMIPAHIFSEKPTVSPVPQLQERCTQQEKGFCLKQRCFCKDVKYLEGDLYVSAQRLDSIRQSKASSLQAGGGEDASYLEEQEAQEIENQGHIKTLIELLKISQELSVTEQADKEFVKLGVFNYTIPREAIMKFNQANRRT